MTHSTCADFLFDPGQLATYQSASCGNTAVLLTTSHAERLQTQSGRTSKSISKMVNPVAKNQQTATVVPRMFSTKPGRIMSVNAIRPVAYTTEFGGVATGCLQVEFVG
jgi:hypothetical protein